MYKVKVALMTITVLLTGIGLASAADDSINEQKKQETDQIAGKSSQLEAEYLAAVKKCEGSEAKEKQQCIESAKQRFGEMLR
jgi:hypothetical protein